MSKPVIILDAGQLVGLSGTTDGDVLTWNGTEWVSSPGGGVGTVTSVALSTASTGLTVSGGTSQTITGSGTFTLGGTLGAGYGGTGLGAPVSGDAGKVLTATAGGGYELTTNGVGTVTSITAGDGLDGGTITDTGTISMPNVGTASTYGSASSVPVFTTDAQGRVSAVTNTSIGISTAQVTGLDTALGTFALKTTTVSAGTGLSGGGDLSANRTISMPNVGTPIAGYGSASKTVTLSTDAQGRVTSATEQDIAIAQSQVADLVNDLAGKVPTTTEVIAGTGLSGGGALSGNVTLSLPSVGTQGTYGSASSVAVVTTDAQGRVSSATTTAIAITQSQVADLVTDLGNKADKSVTATAGTGLAGGGTLASNFSFSLDTVGTAQTDQGSSSKTVTLSTDAYGRVTALSEQSIGSLPASAISSGQLSLAQGGTGIDASSVSAGQLLVGGTGALALQGISQDGSLASDGKLTVTGLQTNPVSATVLGAPDAGKALVWSGTEWQASTIQGGGGGGGLIYFMNYAASSPYPLSTAFDQHAGWDTGAITVANNGNGTVLGTFVTAVGVPGIEVIPAGLWDVNFYAQASSNANSTAVRFKVATLAGATQTVIATSDWVYISDPATVNPYTATVYVPLTDVALTDRIEIILEGRRFTSNAQTITTHFGTDSITHTHTTINAPGGTGLLKVVDGFLQSPATLLVNADVDAAAAIAVAKLAAGTDTYVLTTVSGVPTWSPSAGGGVSSLTGTADQVLVGGTTGSPQTGALTLTLPQSIGTGSSPTFAGLTLDTFSGLLRASAGVLSGGASVSLTGEVTGTLPILNGGTNLTSSGASGNLLVSDGSVWASVPMTGDASIASTGAMTLKNTGSAGTYGSASAVPVFVTDPQGRVTSVTNTSIAISAGAIQSGTLNTTRGGTGVSNPSTGTLLLGAGASAMSSLSGVAGDTIIWSGATWAASPLSSNAVTSLTAVSGGGVTLSGSTGAVTVSVGQSVATSASPSFAGLTLTATPLAVGSGGTGAGTGTLPSINTVFAGASTDPAALPTFRALVAADIPSLSATYLPLSGGTLTGKLITPASTTTTAGLNVPHGAAPTPAVNGDVWTTTSGLFARINGATQQYGALGVSNSWTSTNTFSAATVSFGTSGNTGTVSLGTGATLSGSTKTVNVGTGGVSGSTTTITIGATAGTSTTTLNGTVSLASALAATSGGTGQSSYTVGDILYASAANVLSKGTLSSLDWSGVYPNGNIVIQPGITYGTLTLTAGASATSFLRGGVATGGGDGGDVQIQGGFKSPAGINGAISIGTENTSAVTIGATSVTTTVNGTLSLASALAVGSGGTGVSSLTSNAILIGGATVGALSGSASGQFARWNQTSGAWAATALTGTTNQITVTSDATSTTLSLPQSIATGSSPTFTGLTLSGLTGYLKGNGASVVFAVSTIPVADVTGAAPLASPTFTGIPAAPTPSTSDNSTTIATTAFVKAQTTPYDFASRFVGTPVASRILAEWVADRAVTLSTVATATTGWQFWCVTRPGTTTTNLLVKKNGSTIATFQFTTTSTLANNRYQGLLSGSITSTTLAIGDFLTVESDTTVDAAFSTPIFTIQGTA